MLGGGNNTGSEIKFLSSGYGHFSIYNYQGVLTFANTGGESQTNTTGNSLMTIDGSGNVNIPGVFSAGYAGIGTTTPLATLQVVGTFMAGGGGGTATGQNAIAIGYNPASTGTVSIAIGDGVSASGYDALALGRQTQSSGYASLSTGYLTNALADNSTTMGSNATANNQGSFVYGDASGNSVSDPVANSFNVLATGGYNLYDDATGNPGMTLTDSVSPTVLGTGTVTAGYFIGDGSKLTNLSSGWSLTGNANTNNGEDFIGTTDENPLKLEVNNTVSGYIAIDGTSTSWGLGAGVSTDGYPNTAIGSYALSSSTTGGQNTAVGYLALTVNNSQNGGNTALGNGAGQYNTDGNDLTLIGLNANALDDAGLVNATAIGANAYVAASSSIVLGSISGLNGVLDADVNVGIGTPAPTQKLEIMNGNLLLSNGSIGSDNATVGQLQLQGTGKAITTFAAGDQDDDINYILPTTQGTSNTVLTNDGRGNLSWVAAAGGITLPYSQSTNAYDGPLFQIGNTDGNDLVTYAIEGDVTNGYGVTGKGTGEYGNGVYGTASGDSSGVVAENTGSGPALTARASTGIGLFASSASKTAIGASSDGVHPTIVAQNQSDGDAIDASTSGNGIGLNVSSTAGDAIDATSTFGNALTASGNVVVTGAIVDSISTNGTGTTMYVANGGDGHGVLGVAYGGDGNGVYGQNISGQSTGAGVYGEARGAGTGIVAINSDDSGSGPGLKASTSGSGDAINATANGSGYALNVTGNMHINGTTYQYADNDNGDVVNIENTGNNTALEAHTDGDGNAMNAHADGNGDAIDATDKRCWYCCKRRCHWFRRWTHAYSANNDAIEATTSGSLHAIVANNRVPEPA